MNDTNIRQAVDIPPVFIVSGGAGALGKHVARIVLSQFPDRVPDIVVVPQIRRSDQVADAVRQVADRQGIIIHTMVDPELRRMLLHLAEEYHVPTIDTIGNTLDQMAAFLGQTPLGVPGLYRGKHDVYLDRISAIDYTVEHDDGRKPHELYQADVVLVGVSRVGKTPLSIYLSVLGWKVANVPLVPSIEPPKELFEIDHRRVVGLTIDAEVLTSHRRWRSCAAAAGRSYADLEKLYDEVESARRVFRRGGFAIINVTNKPIEESADQVIELISRWFKHTHKW